MSDYGTGLVTPELASALSSKVDGRARRRAVPILIDSRYDLLKYRGLTACTPNESEVEQMLDTRIGDDLKALERAGRELLKRTRMNAVLITRGSRGMAVFEPDRPTDPCADLRIGRSGRRHWRRRHRHRDAWRWRLRPVGRSTKPRGWRIMPPAWWS